MDIKEHLGKMYFFYDNKEEKSCEHRCWREERVTSKRLKKNLVDFRVFCHCTECQKTTNNLLLRMGESSDPVIPCFIKSSSYVKTTQRIFTRKNLRCFSLKIETEYSLQVTEVKKVRKQTDKWGSCGLNTVNQKVGYSSGNGWDSALKIKKTSVRLSVTWAWSCSWVLYLTALLTTQVSLEFLRRKHTLQTVVFYGLPRSSAQQWPGEVVRRVPVLLLKSKDKPCLSRVRDASIPERESMLLTWGWPWTSVYLPTLPE